MNSRNVVAALYIQSVHTVKYHLMHRHSALIYVRNDERVQSLHRCIGLAQTPIHCPAVY